MIASKDSDTPLSYQQAATLISDRWLESGLPSITAAFVEGLMREFQNTSTASGAIDMGLSVKWAPLNVGAQQVTDFGDYFAWGETTPKKEYTSANYKFFTGDWSYFSGYECSKYNSDDDKRVLDYEDDAASANWGGA